jgi:acetate kinase
MAILAVNAGSSTLKFSLHPLGGGAVLPQVLSGSVQGLEPGGQPSMAWVHQGQAGQQGLVGGEGAFARALSVLADLLQRLPGLPPLQAVAHRVVHGGRAFAASVVVTDDVLERLSVLESLAPLHQPHNLQGIRAFQAAFAHLPQVACFDTAFHTTQSAVHAAFALPAEVVEGLDVRRFGFHGLSYQYLMGELRLRSARASGRVLMAHLGNGASLCAALQGRSLATSMGFSALDGLVMGTRCGSLDAGVLLYLLEQGWSHDRLERLLYRQSGLLGLSGVSADMRRLRADGSARARWAIDVFTHRVVREAGALVACMQGLDVLVFSGGIGEHDAVLRAETVERLAWLGVQLDAQANRQAVGDAVVPVHAASSAVEVWVIPTDEGRVAAQEACALLVKKKS